MSAWVVKCPECGYRLGWIERARSARCFGTVRKPIDCPACNARIIWSRWPWRFMVAGGWALSICGLLGIPMVLNDWSETMVFVWAGLCALLAVLILIGCSVARFELAPLASNALQAIATPPRSRPPYET